MATVSGTELTGRCGQAQLGQDDGGVIAAVDVLVIGGGPRRLLGSDLSGQGRCLGDPCGQGLLHTYGATASAGVGVWYVEPDDEDHGQAIREPSRTQRLARRPPLDAPPVLGRTPMRTSVSSPNGVTPSPTARTATRCAARWTRPRNTCGACASRSVRSGVRILDHSPADESAPGRRRRGLRGPWHPPPASREMSGPLLPARWSWPPAIRLPERDGERLRQFLTGDAH